jgi:hypothetical protein
LTAGQRKAPTPSPHSPGGSSTAPSRWTGARCC